MTKKTIIKIIIIALAVLAVMATLHYLSGAIPGFLAELRKLHGR
jgi:hypothetical protein